MISYFVFLSLIPRPQRSTLFPYTTLFRSLLLLRVTGGQHHDRHVGPAANLEAHIEAPEVGEPEVERSEEHTSELQSHSDLVCRLLLEKKKQKKYKKIN